MKIKLNIGKGLGFSGVGKLTTKINPSSESAGLIVKKDNGMYIPSLKGKDGGAGGSSVDNYTIIDNGGALMTNRDVVQMAFTMCAWKTVSNTSGSYDTNGSSSRTTHTINILSPNTRKQKYDVIQEINWRFNQGYTITAYNMIVGDILLFKNGISPAFVNSGTAFEDGNRYVGDYIHALFVVEAITRNGVKVSDITLRCLWSDNTVGYQAGAILA